ncbi:MAG: TIGR03084 family metal-binding protein [Desulfatibacillaceae bacterium]
MRTICRDLENEHARLDGMVSGLDEGQWRTKILFENWTVADTVAHIAYFDHKAWLAVADPDGFKAHARKLFGSISSMEELAEATIAGTRDMAPAELLDWWRGERARMLDAFRSLDPKHRLPWYGPDMSARSSATARLMETWAHGQDVVDVLGLAPPPSTGLRHIAHLGVQTFGWSFKNRGLKAPDAPIRVEITGPDGELWTWGDPDAADRITGPAQDFCLVVVQRRHVDDTGLAVTGDAARQWMLHAQAFAGPPDMPPPPGSFPRG